MKYVGICLSVLLLVFLIIRTCTTADAKNRESSAEDMEKLPNFKDGKFQNPTPVNMSEGSPGGMFKETFFGKQVRKPKKLLPIKPIVPDSLFTGADSILKVTLVGHSTLIIEIDGQKIITDPVFSRNPSPVPFIYRIKRFQGDPPINAADLPPLDAVVISHNHYDHLDKESIKQIKDNVQRFICPLGVDQYLIKWGVPKEKVIALNWGSSAQLGTIKLTAAPAQHFSGRGPFSFDKSLWASWVIAGPHHRVFFSGDSGYFTGFKEIGQKYGPFDLTMLDAGQYDVRWQPVHMTPEQAIQAHIDLKGEVFLPIHWGSFSISFHDWWEPPVRALAEAAVKQITVATPLPGESIMGGQPLPQTPWWQEYIGHNE